MTDEKTRWQKWDEPPAHHTGEPPTDRVAAGKVQDGGPKRRLIGMTDRRPVSIIPEEWPRLASVTGDSETAGYRQMPEGLDLKALAEKRDYYELTVRLHSDGRVLVHARLEAADQCWKQPAQGVDQHAGELLRPPAKAAFSSGTVAYQDIVQAIVRVGNDCDLPRPVILGCIASLPPEEL